MWACACDGVLSGFGTASGLAAFFSVLTLCARTSSTSNFVEPLLASRGAGRAGALNSALRFVPVYFDFFEDDDELLVVTGSMATGRFLAAAVAVEEEDDDDEEEDEEGTRRMRRTLGVRARAHTRALTPASRCEQDENQGEEL